MFHEDIKVVDRLQRGEIMLENLHILDHRRGYRVGPAFVYGLGGNLLSGSKMLHGSLAGGAGKIWGTLSQYRELVELADRAAQSPGPRIFGGHMGAPKCMFWNPFAVRSLEEAQKRLKDGLDTVQRACLGAASSKAAWVTKSLAVIGSALEDAEILGGSVGEPRWYRRMTHINLPDARVGYAVLDIGETGWKLQTCPG